MKQYLDLLQHIRTNGTMKSDRTGTGTQSIFGYQMRFDLSEGFPLLTTKKVHLKSIIYELLWFIAGDTNVKYLQDHGVTIWDEWADENGDLGPVYGHQWRSWPTPDGGTIDQLSNVINQIKNNPDSQLLQFITKEQALQICIQYNNDSFIDYETGTCKFNSAEFIKVLPGEDSTARSEQSLYSRSDHASANTEP